MDLGTDVVTLLLPVCSVQTQVSVLNSLWLYTITRDNSFEID